MQVDQMQGTPTLMGTSLLQVGLLQGCRMVGGQGLGQSCMALV